MISWKDNLFLLESPHINASWICTRVGVLLTIRTLWCIGIGKKWLYIVRLKWSITSLEVRAYWFGNSCLHVRAKLKPQTMPFSYVSHITYHILSHSSTIASSTIYTRTTTWSSSKIIGIRSSLSVLGRNNTISPSRLEFDVLLLLCSLT